MRLAIKCLGYPLLMMTIVTTPLVSAPEKDKTPANVDKTASAAKIETGQTTPGPLGSVRYPAGPASVQVPPHGVVTVAVPSSISTPAALYNLAPRPKTPAGPRLAEVPTPKKYKPRATGTVDPDFVAQHGPAPVTAATPPLTTSFDSLNFESNVTLASFVFIPPDSSGVAGPGHVVAVTNASLSFHDKATGAVTFESSLQAFFASLAPLTYTFDPKVVYDQFAGRFIIVTLEATQTAGGAPADTSRLLVAVSENADPNGTWYLTSIDGSEVFVNPALGASADHWTDYPGLAVDEEVVYLTGNLFAFGSGEFGGVRLWVIDKGIGSGGFYVGGAAGVSKFDPYAGCGPGVTCFETGTQPAHVFGAAPAAPANVGTWLVSYNGLTDGNGPGFDEYVQVVRVDDPIGPGVTAFTQEFVNVGDIEDPLAASLPGAEQLGISDTIATNDRRTLQAVWRDNDRLYLTTTILPDPPGPDAGQATAHWFQIDTAPLVGITLVDQGNVSGEDIHPSGAVHTFFPSISVNDDDTVAVGFSASSASIYAGSYYATRESVDPPGSIGASFTLRAGAGPYLRTFCANPPVNRWGDYSGMSVDPVDQCFWVYNQHALPTGSPTSAPCQTAGNEVGRWGTAFGKVCIPTCGNSTVEPGETCDPPGAPAGGNGKLCRPDCTVCGDGALDPGEDCDDGNGTVGDGCENDCTFTTGVCGDGQVNPPRETCDPPAQPAGANGNDCRADCTVCGDGLTDPVEACDDGNTVDTDACRNDCTVPVCGDFIVDAQNGETCDPPGQPAGAHADDCRADCTVCGDAVVDAGEDCDDANTVDTDGCRNDCTEPVCGDGILDSGEDCDDGNIANGDGCEDDCTVTPVCGDGQVNAPGETCDPPGQPAGVNGNDCRVDCTVCGDGIVDPGEDCDDADTDDLNSCRNDCSAPRCGDGIVDAVNSETCDPPGQPAGANGNDCRGNCTVCGDGIPDSGEECDDGNSVDTDACRNDCTESECGDGILDLGEDCDDGNTVNGDGCEDDCTVTPVCGDGQVNAPGETCDPPGQPAGVNGNECRVDCKVCGDGIVDPGEDCDDANTDDLDNCRNDCSAPRCGDGIVDALNSETCDPPGQPAGANDNDCRADCTVCGDGIPDAGEDCDDANTVDTDGCRNDCTMPVCGDGIVDPGEDCDDGNTVDGDGCENDCTPTPECGDGQLNVAGETCDPPGQPAGVNGNDCRADCTVCGDGVVDPGEDCDDANSVDTDACRNNCALPGCGDSVIDPGETCDPPGQPGGVIGNLCRGNCTVCGDGVVDAGEECDDGNALNFDACRNDCANAVCGDGIVDAGEECDDGNTIPGDGCENDCTESPFCGDGSVDAPDETCDPPGQPAGASGNDCRVDCTVCGDGVIDAGEECDDGNADNEDGCRNNCLLPRCGDGVVDAPGETCDPPGQPAGASGNDCRVDCTVCGDGVANPGEDCDDGNAIDGDGCRNDCTEPACGDGIVDAGEECDDGNTTAADGCENDCTLTPFCGDQTVNAPDETCDPPGQPAGAAGNDCRADCTFCGDGVLDPSEECDDGNADDFDGCRNSCSFPRCGDAVVDAPDETCDPPGHPAGAVGNFCRADCTVCGDGVVNAAEECDDGNAQSFDQCRNDCTLPFCGDGIVDASEECDDGNTVPGDGCENDCTDTPVCGDGLVSGPDETCDPPGQPAGAHGNPCRADCTVCGDGVVDAAEECDDGNAINADGCRDSCVLPVCGDGIVDPGEECDDGNTSDGDACSSDCTVTPVCGDGLVNAPAETCDPPGQPAGVNGRICRADCTVCGDGVVDASEDCDDANSDNLDGCRNDCRVPTCGDRVVDAGESCDPPGSPAGASGNDCRGDCTVCGDGIQDPTEDCDDGNSLDIDFCRNNCTIPICGDGILNPAGEECDDGNAVDGDGCETNCSFTRAGALTSLVLSREPGAEEITLNWGSSCLVSDTDFAIYEGAFPDFFTHIPQTCSTGGSPTATFVPATYDTYYLIVPHNVNAEGSYGQGLGVERAASIQACKPRRIGVCQ